MNNSKKLKALRNLPVVYCLITDDEKYIKIGRTKNIKNRMNNIQSGCPFRLTLFACFKTDTPHLSEAYVLDMLSHCNVRGEWFYPNDNDMEFISNHFDKKILEYRGKRDALLQA